MTLEALLATVVADLDDVAASPNAGGGVAWAWHEDVFAVLEAGGGAAEFRLDPSIAAAAIRTPDTDPSPRGRGWVRFRPATLDGHAVDRATAWFVSAYRRTSRG